MTNDFSWGRYPHRGQVKRPLKSRLHTFDASSYLPYGLGRSYGDSCLNSEGYLLDSSALTHFMDFDDATGVLTCEAGVRLIDIIHHCLPRGWFLPVTPGTQFVTLGGAVANDVHGKNHEAVGSFGHFVLCFELLRSTSERILCSPSDNPDYFKATIGGLGLTGFITWVQIKLKPVTSDRVTVESIRYDHLDDFFTLNAESDPDDEYRVAWLDCTAKGKRLGRGHFLRGRHSGGELPARIENEAVTFPVTPPFSLINNLSVNTFNRLYYRRQINRQKIFQSHYLPFFYPLDGILHWNRMYGKKGFLQHQCVIPVANAKEAIRDLLTAIAKAHTGSFLVVLKMMGGIPNRGLLSFPMEGATLAMDFPFQGKDTCRFLHRLDAIVNEASGRIYPAKDANMLPATFQSGYPEWETLESLRDPAITSDFWQRVTGD